MEQDEEEILPILPTEVILNILSRIPIKAVFTCKCVCKSWLDLLKTREFARSHLSNSVPGLLIHSCILPESTTEIKLLKIFDFDDSRPPEAELHGITFETALELKCENIFGGRPSSIDGSADGFLFFRNEFSGLGDRYVCNPITHEYIKLPIPEGVLDDLMIDKYGFGVSRSSNQSKVVRIFQGLGYEPMTESSLLPPPSYGCQVYTLGTGWWRSITPPHKMRMYSRSSNGKLLNGNLRWLAREGSAWISRFDLESEVFTKFPRLLC